MPANKITKSLYNGKVSIDFYPDSHRYKVVGEKEWLVSVTSITGLIDKSGILLRWAGNLTKEYLKNYLSDKLEVKATDLYPIIDEAVIQHQIKKNEAADIGSQIHEFAEKYGKAKIDNTELPQVGENTDERVVNGISAFLDWVEKHKVKFVESERMLYSQTHGYVGLTDVIAVIDDKKYIIDYKSAKAIYDEHKFQLAGYWVAYEEETGEKLDGGMIVKFNKEDGSLEVVEISKENLLKDAVVFLALLTVKKRLKEYAKI